MQTEYAVLYLEINIFSFLLIAIILRKTNGLSKMVAQRNFAMSIIAEMVFFASDTLYVLIQNGVLRFGILDNALMLLCKETYFFATSMMCYFWFIYFEHLRDTAFVKEKRNVRLASSGMIAMGILLVINLFSRNLFYVEPDGSYHRGDFFVLTYILSYIYVLVAFIRTIRDILDPSYAGDKKELILLMIFPIAPGVAGLIQFVYPHLPVACGILSLTTLVLYLNWIDHLISLDPLTGLNNRKQLMHFYDQWLKNRNEGDIIHILMIDADRFKSINDNYGHVQGDKALKNIAESLKTGCRVLPKRANIARYGGDEFAVLFEASDPGDEALLKASIQEKLKEINERTKIPFTLTVSIGSASSDGSLSLKELIDCADEAMYEAKSASRR